MAVQSGGLYATTNDWSYLVQTNKKWAWLQSVLAGELGFDMWATCDGNDWFAVTRDAFTGDEYNFGGRTLQPDSPNGSHLYIGSANQAQGTTVFDDTAPACGSLVKTRSAVSGAAAVKPPTELEDLAAHRGTLLSWKPSGNASSYQVLRAELLPVTLSLKGPPVLPNGFHFEDAAPILTDPGAPGSVQVTLSLPGGFTPVATTNKSYFVDSSRHGRYLYEVRAINAAGTASGPSNLAAVPDSRGPATFAALQQTLAAPIASAARLGSGAGSGSRLQRLLNAARTAWERGDHVAAQADVRALAGTAGQNDQLAALVPRVERRLQYADLVGGP